MQPSFQAMEELMNEILSLFIGLGMSHRGQILFDPQILAPPLDGVVAKLLSIIQDNNSG